MSSTNSKFSIELPKGWEDQTVHYFIGPEEGGVQHSLTLFVDPRPSTSELSNYARERIEQSIDSLPGAEIVKEEPVALDNGLQAYEAVLKWVPGDDHPRLRRLVFVIDGDKAYTFTADFTKRSKQTIGMQVQQMINSFIPG